MLKSTNKIIQTIIAIFLAFGFQAQEQLQLIDKIVGVVGNEIILLSDHTVQKSELMSRGMGGSENLDCTVMENLLFEKLLLNQAR